MFRWEPEGRYRHRLCTMIALFWFSTEHLWTLSPDEVKCFNSIQVCEQFQAAYQNIFIEFDKLVGPLFWRCKSTNFIMHFQGRIQDFHRGGGGGAKDYLCAHTWRAQSPKSLIVYGRGPWKLSGFWCFLVLSEPFSYQHCDTKWDAKVQSRSKFRGCLLRPL